jgi:cell division protein YceG involved in septum cleavage
MCPVARLSSLCFAQTKNKMKISIAIAFSLSLFTASVAVFGTSSSRNSVHIVSSKKKDLFVFKVNKSWQGARVEVLAANGECVSRQRLLKRKMIINFCDMKPGTYKINVTKSGLREEFDYIKN